MAQGAPGDREGATRAFGIVVTDENGHGMSLSAPSERAIRVLRHGPGGLHRMAVGCRSVVSRHQLGFGSGLAETVVSAYGDHHAIRTRIGRVQGCDCGG